MTVYVDNMRMKAKLWRWNGVWSNLWASTTPELEDFAEELKLSPMCMVDRGYTTERYIITETKRLEAISLGARPIRYGQLHMQAIISRKREAGWKEKVL